MKAKYSQMEYRRCGQSGLDLSLLALGGWHNFETYEKARDLCRFSFQEGITYFDLANNYGPPGGMAEYQFGRVLNTDLAAHRDEMVIATKA
ncbi:MAG: aldo/keto reductase, partial [Verrucomicrobiota bacterium]